MSFFRRAARPSPTPSPTGSAAPILAANHQRSNSFGSNASSSPLGHHSGVSPASGSAAVFTREPAALTTMQVLQMQAMKARRHTPRATHHPQEPTQLAG
jgi:hypothetical protein